jgi:hypothetical protein
MKTDFGCMDAAGHGSPAQKRISAYYFALGLAYPNF